jgi:transcriptional regulator with XRE-family HTH domain
MDVAPGASCPLRGLADLLKEQPMNEFPGYIRQLRIARGLTQLDLADMLGVPPGLISAWELGRATPTPAQLNAAMRVLSGDVQRALNLIEGVSPSTTVLPPTPTPEALAAVVLDSVAADPQRAESLLYEALRTVISSHAPRVERRRDPNRRRRA